MAIDVKRIYILADQYLNHSVQLIQGEQWDMKTPATPEWSYGDSGPMTLRDAVNYVAYDVSWIPDTFCGKTMEDVGNKYDGDLLGHDPKERFADIVNRATSFVEELDDLDRKVHFTYGTFPAAEALTHQTQFHALRVFDIARLIGANLDMPEELAQGVYDEVLPGIEMWRQIGVYPASVEVPANAPVQDRLLGMVGCQPRS